MYFIVFVTVPVYSRPFSSNWWTFGLCQSDIIVIPGAGWSFFLKRLLILAALTCWVGLLRLPCAGCSLPSRLRLWGEGCPCLGLLALQLVGSSWTGGWTHIPWIYIALAENFIQIFPYPDQFLANPIISLQCFAHLPVASSATQVLWVTCLYPHGPAFTMILMPRRWLFLLNKSNRAFVPRKCVSFCFVLVCRSVFLWLLTLSGLFRDFSVACCLDVLSSWSAFSWGALTTWSCPAACQHFGIGCHANGQC